MLVPRAGHGGRVLTAGVHPGPERVARVEGEVVLAQDERPELPRRGPAVGPGPLRADPRGAVRRRLGRRRREEHDRRGRGDGDRQERQARLRLAEELVYHGMVSLSVDSKPQREELLNYNIESAYCQRYGDDLRAYVYYEGIR